MCQTGCNLYRQRGVVTVKLGPWQKKKRGKKTKTKRVTIQVELQILIYIKTLMCNSNLSDNIWSEKLNYKSHSVRSLLKVLSHSLCIYFLIC